MTLTTSSQKKSNGDEPGRAGTRIPCAGELIRIPKIIPASPFLMKRRTMRFIGLSVRTLSLLLSGAGVLVGLLEASAQPSAHTQPAIAISRTSATLTGMAVPNGMGSSAWFQWGANRDYGKTTSVVAVGDGMGVIRVTEPIGPLAPGSNYFYRLVVSNSAGVTFGREQRFVTGGRVVGWGWRTDGRTAVPLSLRDRVAIASGPKHNLALRTDGSVVGWGYNRSGQADVPPELNNVVAVACGGAHSLALRADGTVMAWGSNNAGQTNVPEGLTNVIAVAAGSSTSYALLSNGTVARWPGNVVYGEATNVVSIAANGSQALALKANGTVLGLDNTFVRSGLSNIVAIACGSLFNLALQSDGTILSWSRLANGAPIAPPGIRNVVEIGAGASYCLVLQADGRLVTWGNYNTENQRKIPAGIPEGLKDALAISCGDNHNLALRTLVAGDFLPAAITQTAFPGVTNSAILNGMAVANGLPSTAWFEWAPLHDMAKQTAPQEIGDGTTVVRISAVVGDLGPETDYQFSLVVSNAYGIARGATGLFTTGRKVATWGTPYYSLASVPAAAQPAVRIAAGHTHCLALSPDRTVIAWGGSDSEGETNVPPGLTDVVDIAGGLNSSAAVRADGSIAGWGTLWNLVDRGGWSEYVAAPFDVPEGLSNVVAVVVGDSHAMALKSDGTVTAWGYDNSGQTFVPGGFQDVVAIAAGSRSSTALRADGTVCAWGNYVNDMTAVPIWLSNVVAISSESFGTVALKRDGKIQNWGGGGSPIWLSNVVAIAANMDGAMALRDDGRVFGWGGGSGVPDGLENAVAISGGDLHGMALAPNVMPHATASVATGGPDAECTIAPAILDPNGDSLVFRVSRLPPVGHVYQYTANGRGAPITLPGTQIEDPLGRIVFIPEPGALGGNYTTLEIVANDGEDDSAPSLIAIHIVPSPVLEPGMAQQNGTKSFVFGFTGVSNATYSVWASGELRYWTRLGSATPLEQNTFMFADPGVTNYQQRFYRVVSP